MFTKEDKINRTEAWKAHCHKYAHLAGIDREIREELELERKERKAEKERIIKANPTKKIIFDPFVGYIAIA